MHHYRFLREATRALLLAACLCWSAVAGADTIKIAFIDPLSGPLAGIVQSNLRQYQAAAARTNAHGGALGLRFEIVPFDSKSTAEEALAALKTAIDQGIRYVTQGVGSDIAAVLVEAIEAHNSLNPSRTMLLLNYGAFDPVLTNAGCSFWHFSFDPNRTMRLDALAGAIADDEAIRRVFLLNPDTGPGQDAGAEAKQRLAAMRAGIEIVGDELHAVGQKSGFGSIAERIADARADAVLTASRGNDLALLVDAVHKAGLETRIFALHAAERGTPAVLGAAGAGRVTTVLTWHPNIANNQLEEFANAYKSRHEEDWTSLSSYLAVQMLATAIESTRTLDPLRVARMFEGIDFLGPAGPVRMRRDDHQIFQPLYLATFTRAGADGVKSDAEGSGFGWKTDLHLESNQTVVPTTCRMRRPG